MKEMKPFHGKEEVSSLNRFQRQKPHLRPRTPPMRQQFSLTIPRIGKITGEDFRKTAERVLLWKVLQRRTTTISKEDLFAAFYKAMIRSILEYNSSTSVSATHRHDPLFRSRVQKRETCHKIICGNASAVRIALFAEETRLSTLSHKVFTTSLETNHALHRDTSP